jgi:hypothetical protein
VRHRLTTTNMASRTQVLAKAIKPMTSFQKIAKACAQRVVILRGSGAIEIDSGGSNA